MGQAQVSVATIVRVVVVATLVAALLYLIYLVRGVVGLVVVAAFLAVAIAPAVNWLDRRGTPRWVAILLVYLAGLGSIVGIGLLIVPPLVSGVTDLSDNIPGYVSDLRHNDTFRSYDDKYNITKNIKQQATDLPTKLGDAAGTLRDVTVGVFSSLIKLFSILVMAFFLVRDGERLLEFGFRQFSEEREARLRGVAGDIAEAIVGYVFGNVVISVLAGLVTYLTLLILGIPFPVPLAILFGFFDLVPLVGATLGGILVGIVVAFNNFPVGLIVWAGVLILYQQIENNMIQPFVYGRTVQLHPLVVIVAILIGGSLLGVLGALVAIPAAAAVQAIVRDYWRYSRGTATPPPPPPPVAEAAPG
jgi:predicted PurR-regulated permease PerM